ncbi:MAG: dipeptide ABC transporter ATP-binding protein [Boseongicola sp.]|nr:dipeptide ABC transporter ATP-binding protein [Boseongicola sp.]NNJ67466.1 ABC transporter ATP-binding protein [Boseongicola sp.]
MTLLRIENLSLKIRGIPILNDISMSLDEGRVLGVIGESGSGKSMTAFSILQLLPKGSTTTGRLCVDGLDTLEASEEDLCKMRGNDVSIVFQEPMTALNPLKNIGQQVAESILIHEPNTKRSDALERAQEALQRCELPASRFPTTLYPHELSGGQRQRVVIALAIALRPKLLIADEPTTALDVTTQAEILGLLKRLVEEDGMGLLLISHDLAVVADMADDIVIMKDGQIVESGAAASIFQELKHPYTRALYEASSHVPERTQQSARRPLLTVRDVVRDYQLPRRSLFSAPEHFRAVDHVSFEVFKGESVGLVGESGCGKSTLTRAILGLEQIQEGEVFLNGTVIQHGKQMKHSLRRQMQAVFQDPYGSFNPRHHVGRLISEPLHLLGEAMTTIDKQETIAAALRAVGLTSDDQYKYIHEFSGGQRQRIAIARALIVEPELILLDEATSALDVSIRAQILDLLADLATTRGLTYLFISHDLSVVRSITDRVLVMSAGKIVEEGATNDVFERPRHAYTKELIAASPTLP